jgi:hypothetical protein
VDDTPGIDNVRYIIPVSGVIGSADDTSPFAVRYREPYLALGGHSTKADLYRRLGRIPEALEALGKAPEMSQLEPEKRFLQQRIQK